MQRQGSFMSNNILGIDVAKHTFEVALLSENRIRSHRFANSQTGFEHLSAWVTTLNLCQVQACMEATGPYHQALALYLHAAGHTLSVVNPLRIKGFARAQMQRNKTDRVDAVVIARFCEALHPEPWNPPPSEVLVLQGLLRRQQSLDQMRQQEINRREMPDCCTAVQHSIEQVVKFLDQQIDQLKKQIAEHFNEHPDLNHQQQLLCTIPGIAELTAARLLGEFLGFGSFSNARQLAAFAGLSPRQHQSGQSVQGRTHLSKTGNSNLRKALYFPALTALRYNPRIVVFAKRLEAAGKSKMSIIGAVMRKLVHYAFGVLKSGRPFDSGAVASEPV
jgi:transposase